MTGLRQFRRRLAVLFHRERFDCELEEEMRSHLEMEAEENRANGMDANRARLAARKQFGNLALVSEDSRSAWSWAYFDTLAADVRHAFRRIRRRPGVAALAVISLAIAFAPSVTMFSVMDRLFLTRLPLRPRKRSFGSNFATRGSHAAYPTGTFIIPSSKSSSGR